MSHERSPSPRHMPATGMESSPAPTQGPMAAPGMGNAATLERMRAGPGLGHGQGPAKDQGAGPSQFSGQEQLRASVQKESLVASNVDAFVKSNVYKAMVRLVDKEGWEPETSSFLEPSGPS